MKFMLPIAGMFLGSLLGLAGACWLGLVYFRSQLDVCCSGHHDYTFHWTIGFGAIGLGALLRPLVAPVWFGVSCLSVV